MCPFWPTDGLAHEDCQGLTLGAAISGQHWVRRAGAPGSPHSGPTALHKEADLGGQEYQFSLECQSRPPCCVLSSDKTGPCLEKPQIKRSEQTSVCAWRPSTSRGSKATSGPGTQGWTRPCHGTWQATAKLGVGMGNLIVKDEGQNVMGC